MINTFLKQYEQGGRLPVWELASNETDCMIGYHSVSVMADAMAKGLTGFDYEKAFEAAKHSAMLDHLGLEAYKNQGFISMDDEHESVSKTLEYAYDDWCIAQMAMILNKKDDYDYFMKRSQSWKNVFDWTTGFMRPKKNGGWDKPFDPREINNNFTEGNSWQYSFFVPQDIPGMIELSSKVATLYPGDIIAAGTPAGVGPVQRGDRVRIQIEHVGEMTLLVK
jgi:putative alpha-1,2-mannosidase